MMIDGPISSGGSWNYEFAFVWCMITAIIVWILAIGKKIWDKMSSNHALTELKK